MAPTTFSPELRDVACSKAKAAVGAALGVEDDRATTWGSTRDSAASAGDAQKLASFTDVRELQRQLKAQGVQLVQEADETTTGPASFVAVDPDDNPILVDQHV